MSRRLMLKDGEKKIDFIFPRDVDPNTNQIATSKYKIITDFQLKVGQTYIFTGRYRGSQFYTDVFGSVSTYPYWTGSQFYFSRSYFNTTRLSSAETTTISFKNTYDFEASDARLLIFGSGHVNRAANMEFRSLQVFEENGEEAFNAVASYDNSGIACVYDVVSKKFYYAFGGDVFEGGYDV